MRKNTYISLLTLSIIIAVIASAFIYLDRKKSAPLLAANLQLGTFIITQTLEVNYNNNNDIATSFKTAAESSIPNEIKKYQNVILYDEDNKIMPLAGKISMLNQSSKGKDILISLPKDTDTTLLNKTVDVITYQADRVRMVPLRAIQYEQNGDAFLWTASKEETHSKYKLTKQEIDISKKNSDYAILLNRLNAQALILLNPHEDIELDKEYGIKLAMLDVPNDNPIYMAWQNYVNNRNRQKVALLALRAENCGNPDVNIDTSSIDTPVIPQKGAASNPTSDSDSQSGSCGGGGGNGGIISAEQIFSNIDAIYNSSGTAKSCGTSSCGQ